MRALLGLTILLISTVAAATATTSVSSAPIDGCEHSVSTAKSELSAIYSAERAFHAEYDAYTDGFFEIGYEPDENAHCDLRNWSVSIDQSSDGSRFLARARSKITGEEWVIDDRKELKSVKR